MSVAEIASMTQYLTFTLDEELFAIDIAQTLEVLEVVKITKIPRLPDFMLGVINLRGNVIPVVDVRKKFKMQEVELSINSCIVIVEITVLEEKTVIGILVDSVEEVFDLEPEDIEAAPKIGTSLNTEFLKGMGKRGSQFIMILNIDKVFSIDELTAVQEAGKSNSKKQTKE